MSPLKLFFACLVPMLLGACASGLPGLRPKTYVTPGESRIFYREGLCPHSEGTEQSVPALTAFAVEASKQALANFGSILRQAAEGGDLQPTSATKNIQVQRGTLPRCIMIVRGIWGATDGSTNDANWKEVLKPWPVGQLEAEKSIRIQALGLKPISTIHHVIELEMETSQDATALTLIPIFVKVVKSTDGGTDGTRELSVAVDFGVVGEKDKSGSVVTIPHRELGKAYHFQDRPYEAPWFTGPFTPAVGESQPKVADKAKANAMKVDLSAVKRVPVTISSRVVETRPTREFLSFIAAVYGTALPTLQEEVKNAIDTKSTFEAKKADRAKESEGQATAATELAEAQGALNAYCSSENATPNERSPLAAKARAAQFSANKAAVDAGEPIPYPNVITVTGQPIADWNRAICDLPR